MLNYCWRTGLTWKRGLRPGGDWREDVIDRSDRVLSGTRPKFIMTDRELDSLRFDGKYVDDGCIVLRPPEGQPDVLPVLAFAWDKLVTDQPVLRLRLGLFVKDDEKKIKFIGMRFETPECNSNGGEGQTGDHDYYHAQPINGFDKNDGLSENHSIKWLPVRLPATPLAATEPLGLFASMLVSLYGGKIINELSVSVRLGGGRERLNKVTELLHA